MHKFNALSAFFKRTVCAVVIESDLRATFHIGGDTVFTTTIGTQHNY